MDPTGEDESVDSSQIELAISGTRQHFVGDRHVWLWYRGTGVGPYPCFSALQALERVCDQLIKTGTPIRTVVSLLLDGCENLAMVGLIVGLLVRHLENADQLLDVYFTEPFIWKLEFERVICESDSVAADSEGLVAPERRHWSLRRGMCMAMRADVERAAELRSLGDLLVSNARHQIGSVVDDDPMDRMGDSSDSEQQLALVRSWARCLDRDTYQVHETPGGVYIQAQPSEDITQALEPRTKDVERGYEATRLVVRYYIDPKQRGTQPVGVDSWQST